MRTFAITPCTVLLLLGSAAASWAQEPHVAGPEELTAAVVRHADAIEMERERLGALLDRPEVREVARTHGIDMERVERGLATLPGAALMRLAPNTRAAEAAMQRDGISATQIIIILVLLIALILIT